MQKIHRQWAKKWYNYGKLQEKYAILFAFNPPWNDCIAEGCIKEGEDKVRPAPPTNPHPTSHRTPADYPQELKKRAKAKREQKAAKTEKIEAKNVVLTHQDVQKKKEGASASRQVAQRKTPLLPPVL